MDLIEIKKKNKKKKKKLREGSLYNACNDRHADRHAVFISLTIFIFDFDLSYIDKL